MHVEDLGSGPAVLLLHGMPSAPSDFAPLVARLAPHRRVLVPHLQGYGLTPADPGGAAIDATVARIERALGNLGVDRVDCVGFSAGAYKAVALALRGRVRVGRLALLAPHAGVDGEGARTYREIAAAASSGVLDPRPSWLQRMTAPGFDARDPEAAARVLAWLDAVSPAVLCAELFATADAPDLRPRLPTLRQPVLVCAGELDATVPPQAAQEIARAIPGAAYESIPGVGHAMLLEASERVSAVVADFMLGAGDASARAADAVRLLALDHVNIRTARVPELVAFYCDLLGLTQGTRPPFPFPGAWLYCGDRPVVHLVEVPAADLAAADPERQGLSHFAFRATGADALVARLRAAGIPHQRARVPSSGVVQVHVRDPDRNALHLDFDE